MTMSLTEAAKIDIIDSYNIYYEETEMKQNVGGIDRLIRGVVGVAGIAVYFMGMLEGTMAMAALIIGAVLLGTVILGWCPPYAMLGISTRSAEADAE